jgi:hypothetical protein
MALGCLAPKQRMAMRVGSFAASVPVCGSAWSETGMRGRSLPAERRPGGL